ncbi:hypothetical protein TNCT_462741 [Trichonephila clavata]|uniref:Uncharacterized protein n=1 Tax=Trichonephila clavata TaxID=2740835 RepID=A0A8X6JDU6_TRICU|nr:hypothetical protein TNCT_462741 [Trichonephila clavata]
MTSAIPGAILILSAATTINSTKSSAEFTVSRTRNISSAPRRKKSSWLRPVERVQATNLPRPIRRVEYVAFKSARPCWKSK